MEENMWDVDDLVVMRHDGDLSIGKVVGFRKVKDTMEHGAIPLATVDVSANGPKRCSLSGGVGSIVWLTKENMADAGEEIERMYEDCVEKLDALFTARNELAESMLASGKP